MTLVMFQRLLMAFVAGVAFGAFLFYKFSGPTIPEAQKVIVRTKTDTVYSIKVDSVPYAPVSKGLVKVSKVTVPVYSPKNGNDSVLPPAKTASLYEGSKQFPGLMATIRYKIYADSLYGTSFGLEIMEKEIIKTTETDIRSVLPPRPKFFLGGGVNMAKGSVQSAEAGVLYSHKQKWAASASVGQNLDGSMPAGHRTYTGLRLYFNL